MTINIGLLEFISALKIRLKMASKPALAIAVLLALSTVLLSDAAARHVPVPVEGARTVSFGSPQLKDVAKEKVVVTSSTLNSQCAFLELAKKCDFFI